MKLHMNLEFPVFTILMFIHAKLNSTTEGSNSDESTFFASVAVTSVAAFASQVTSVSSHSSHHQPT